MKILYIYRNQSLGFSIAKVFHTIEEKMSEYAEVDRVYLPYAGVKPWMLWKNIKVARHAALAKDYDIVHITGGDYYLTPFLRGKYKVVVTVHDLGFFTNYSFTPRTFILYLLWIRALSKADKITCISEKTMEEVKKYVPLNPEKICTIHNPVGNEFTFTPKQFNDSYPVILQIGTKSNKNLNNTIISLKNFPHNLRIIGILNSDQKALLEMYHVNYSNASNLTDEEIVHEYEQCDIVNFPSFYEGFGMPIIEGQAVGRVVITSNLSPMKEIAGDGAVFVNPADCLSILNGYKEAVEKHDVLVKRGLENVKRFKIEEIVCKYYSLYKDTI